MPSQSRIHFVKREQQKQYVLHLMYASPVRRGEVEILEDFPVLRDIKVKVRVPEELKKVQLIPQEKEIAFEKEEDGYTITVPALQGHQMLIMAF